MATDGLFGHEIYQPRQANIVANQLEQINQNSISTNVSLPMYAHAVFK